MNALALFMLLGPFPRLADYCSWLERHPWRDNSDTPVRCELEESGLAGGPSRRKSARIFLVRGLDHFCTLAVRNPAGWWVQERGIDCGSERGTSELAVTATTFLVEEGRLIFRYRARSASHAAPGPPVVRRWKGEVVCTLPEAGAPHCR